MFLLDTNIVSEVRKVRPHGAVMAWIAKQQSHSLYLSAMTIAEIQQGIERRRDQDAGRAAELERWLEGELLPGAQVLAMDTPICRAWARLMRNRSNTIAEDAFIAATAQCHGLTVVTRNISDFVLLGVPLLNPFEFRGD